MLTQPLPPMVSAHFHEASNMCTYFFPNPFGQVVHNRCLVQKKSRKSRKEKKRKKNPRNRALYVKDIIIILLFNMTFGRELVVLLTKPSMNLV